MRDPSDIPAAAADDPLTPRYCLRCQALLPSRLRAEAKCRQCGLQFDARDPRTYRESREFVRWKFWLPGLLLAVAAGIASYAICLQAGDLGYALFVAVPVSVGTLLGFGCQVRWWGLPILAVVAIFSIVTALIEMDFAGFFCGSMLAIIFATPVFIGAILGMFLRVVLQSSRWGQRWFFGHWLVLMILIVLPYAVQGIELALPRRTVIETVTTELKIDASPQEAWNAVMFYEEVRHEPPWLLKLALPKPTGSVGSKQREGEIVTCFYDRGYLKKRISRCEEGRLLAFDVIEQHLHFEKDVRLRDGSFEIRPAGENQTVILLITRYDRLLRPAWMWRSTERHVVHTLHGHVLEGMRLKVAKLPHEQSPSPPHEYPGKMPELAGGSRVGN